MLTGIAIVRGRVASINPLKGLNTETGKSQGEETEQGRLERWKMNPEGRKGRVKKTVGGGAGERTDKLDY